MNIKINRQFWIFFAFFLLTIGNSAYLIQIQKNSIIEYLGNAILMLTIWYCIMIMKNHLLQIKKMIKFSVISIFFLAGLLVQEMKISITIRLSFTMLAIATFAVLSSRLFSTYLNLRLAAYAIFVGILVACVLAMVNNVTVFSGIIEGSMSSGFNGGLEHKNFFAADLLASFSGIYLYYKNVERKRIDLIVMIIEIVMLVLSFSRGGYILLAFYLFLLNYEKIKKIRKDQRKILVLFICILIAFGAYYFYDAIASNSETYMYRIRGLLNYLNYCSGDWFHIVFGNAQLAYSSDDLSYVYKIRSVVGWDGSLELSVLNILIKNGIIGLVAYIYIIFYACKNAGRINNWSVKSIYIAYLYTFILSGFVESYWSNIHVVYCAFSYIFVTSVVDISKDEEIVINRRKRE